jgi:hypothetical protein
MTRQNGSGDGKGKTPRRAIGRGPGGRHAISSGRSGPGGSTAPRRRAPAPQEAPGPEAPRTPTASAEAPKRKARGFLHAAAMTRGQLGAAFGKRGFAEARVLLDWRAIMGEALAAHCRPVKVSYAAKGFGATLVVLAEGARAPEVEMLAPRIVERVNAHYGYRAIARVKITQTAGFAGLAEASREFERRPGKGEPGAALPPAEAGEVARTVSEVADPDLRAALDRLGRNVRARALRKRGGARA